MKKLIEHFITLNNKKYVYTLKPAAIDSTFVECKAANIAQEFPNEDIAELLADLPNLILAEKNYKKNQSETIRFRVSVVDKKFIEKMAVEKGYTSVSSYLRNLAMGEPETYSNQQISKWMKTDKLDKETTKKVNKMLKK